MIFQGIFSSACVLDVIICLIYTQTFDTDIGSKCAYIALDLTGFTLLFPIVGLPISLVLNIISLCLNNDPRKKRLLWLLWTVFSPILYAFFWLVSIIVFVASTGGV